PSLSGRDRFLQRRAVERERRSDQGIGLGRLARFGRDVLRVLSLGRRVWDRRLSFQRRSCWFSIPAQFQIRRLSGRQQHRVEKHSTDDVRHSTRSSLCDPGWRAFALALARKIFSRGRRSTRLRYAYGGPASRGAPAPFGLAFALPHDAPVSYFPLPRP